MIPAGCDWTIIGDAPSQVGGGEYKFCRCKCGREKPVKLYYIQTGRSRCCVSCAAKKAKTVHGHAGPSGAHESGAYKSWQAMLSRVKHNPGYRRVKVCARWQEFAAFYEDMGDRPEGATIERKDNSKGYNKDNCRWATRKEQGRNKTTNVRVVIDGVEKLLTEWLAELPIAMATYYQRTRKGMSPFEALTTPVRSRKS